MAPIGGAEALKDCSLSEYAKSHSGRQGDSCTLANLELELAERLGRVVAERVTREHGEVQPGHEPARLSDLVAPLGRSI